MKRVLLTSRSGQLGGMELRLADEARELATHGVHPVLAVSRFPGCGAWRSQLCAEGLEFADFEPPPFYEEWRLRHVRHLLARAFFIPRLRRLAPDLVHVAYAWTQTGGSHLWLAGATGLPTVISVHNVFPAAAFTPWHERLAQQAFRSVRGIYGVSESALRAFEAIYGRFFPSHVVLRTIHNFVDTARFVPSADARMQTRDSLGIPRDVPLIGSIARIDQQKDPLAVARVFARIQQQLPDAHLLYVGRGPLEGQLAAEVRRLGISERVRFAGFSRDVSRIYPALDVHLLLSLREGFGISSAEAMSCGVPVVATDVPGTRDVLHGREGGVLVQLADEEAACRAVLDLLRSPQECRARGESGRATAIAEFSKPRWQSAIRHFYDNMLGNSPLAR
jgi:hypothetical protein